MTLAPLLDGSLPRPTLSFEIYPPRSASGADAASACLSALAGLRPDFFSVTCGASGSGHGGTLDVLAEIVATTSVTPMAHLTCVGASRAEVIASATAVLDLGVRDILALRGDPPAGVSDWRAHPDGVARACDLVELLQVVDHRRAVARRAVGAPAEGPLSTAVACFPQAGGSDPHGSDLAALKAKQDAGAAFAITQVCYDADVYAAFVARARRAGITLAILPGVIPMTDPARLQRLESLTGVAAPPAVMARLSSAAEHGAAARHREGIRASVDLAHALLDAGAPGLHIYTFNSPHAATDLVAGADLAPPPALPLPRPSRSRATDHSTGPGRRVPATGGHR